MPRVDPRRYIPDLEPEPERRDWAAITSVKDRAKQALARRAEDRGIEIAPKIRRRRRWRLRESGLQRAAVSLVFVALVLSVVIIAWVLGRGIDERFHRIFTPPMASDLSAGPSSAGPRTSGGDKPPTSSAVVELPAGTDVVSMRLRPDELASIRDNFGRLVLQQVGQRAIDYLVVAYYDVDPGRAAGQAQSFRNAIWDGWAANHNVQVQAVSKPLPANEPGPYAEVELHLKP